MEEMPYRICQAGKNMRSKRIGRLYCENYLEGFHIPFVHHSLNEIVDYGTRTRLKRFAIQAFKRVMINEGSRAARYFFIFPEYDV